MEYSDYLEHHGVKGMKWGVRKQKSSSGTRKKRRKKLSSLIKKVKKKKISKVKIQNESKKQKEESKQRTSSLKKSVRDMSDSELDRNITRLQKEKLYKDLSSQTVKSGNKFVKDVLTTAGKAVAIEAAKNLMAYGLNTATGQNVAKTSIKSKSDQAAKQQKIDDALKKKNKAS